MRTTYITKRTRTLRRRRLALALVAAMAAPAAMAQSACSGSTACLPVDGVVTSGTITSTLTTGGKINNYTNQSNTNLTITQTTRGGIIDWGSFNIGAGHTLTFAQPVDGVTLNRVVGFGYGSGGCFTAGGCAPTQSSMFGNLSANGHVFIVNTAGITFASGSQVNVGGLVASTVDILDTDFLAGVTSNNYIFRGQSGASQVYNTGSITATKTGTLGGRVGFVGTDLYNNGTIDASGGSVVFGAASSVTLDFQGDGLTQVTVNGLAAPAVVATARNYGDINADGGQILMRSLVNPAGQGGVINGGMLRARSLATRAGRVELTAPGGGILLGDMRDGYLGGGFIDVTGNTPGLTGGSVLLDGGTVTVMSDPLDASQPSWINASGSAGGGMVDIFASATAALFPGTRINADATDTGNGGLVRIIAGDDLLAYGDISANAGQAGGNGGIIGLQSQAGNAVVAGNLNANGASSGNGGEIAIVATGGAVGTTRLVSASGGVNGGRVQLLGAGVVVGEASTLAANGASEAGGDIIVAGGGAMAAYGTLTARGGGTGGNVTTFSGGDFDIRGIDVDAGGGTTAGLWSLVAPDITVISGGTQGTVATATFATDVQDADISNALGNETSVTLRAGSAATDSGNIHFSDGVDISYAGGTVPLYLRADAQGSITGSNFRIATNAAPLSMAFNADANNLNNGFAGISFNGATLASGGGDILFYGQSDTANGVASSYATGVQLGGSTITTAGGNVLIRGASTGGDAGSDDAGVVLDTTSIDAGGGAVSIYGSGAGVTSGVILGFSGINAGPGGVVVTGQSIEADGLNAYGSDIVASGGEISLTGLGGARGVYFDGDLVATGGAIRVHGEGGTGEGIDFPGGIDSGGGDITMYGQSAASVGLDFGGGSASNIVSAGGDTRLTGIGATLGLALAGGTLSTNGGHIDLRGRGTGAASDGLLIGAGMVIATPGGGIELSGEGGSGAGVGLASGSSVAAGNSLVVVRAANDGSSDAIRLGGSISSSLGVNLRPGGVDANGALTERVNDQILIGGGSAGFALSGTELALIDTPQLVIGSNLHVGSIQVLGAMTRNGNLTLQNDGGGGGIALQAAVNVGGGVLALSSGGDITQTSAGAITAHSLLARAGGDVLLARANNNVAATTLAGSAGGDFEYQDVDALAIGTVSALGMDAGSNGLAGFSASGISAGGDVFVRNLAGDLTLNANVSGVDIDLVTANTLQNPVGASLLASGDWRVWANTWVGETRGGLVGDGNLPNLYGCIYLGGCGGTVGVNQFRYAQRPTALVTFDSFSREYGLPNPVFTFSVTGAILGDTLANVASGSATIFPHAGSDVGTYAISGDRSPLGTFSSAAGYNIQFVPGTMTISPATLFFTADHFVRYLGTNNPLFTGSVTGFRNGDTVQSVFGSGVIWNSPAGLLSPIGFYPVNGGTSATNYVFSQAPGNGTALQIIPLPQLPSTPIDLIRETVNSYVYDRNFGGAPMCALNASLADEQLASTGDELSNEWSKVRSRPNLTNCFETDRKNSCGDF